MHLITSLPAYNARAVLTWYQQGCFPNFSCTRLRTSWTVHSRCTSRTWIRDTTQRRCRCAHRAVVLLDFPNRGFFPKLVLVTEMWHARVPWLQVQIWDPTLGLINDLRAPRLTLTAAALSRVRVLSFVYLFTPINDHIMRFVILLIVCRGSSSNTSGCF